jgi:hypothetical protein
MSLLNKLKTAALVFSSIALTAQAQELISHKINGPKDKRINIAIVGDGYTNAQKSLFEADIQKVIDAIVSDPILSQYEKYHNYYGVWKASAESGANGSDGNCASIKNTAFESRYCAYDIERLLVSNTALVEAAVNAVLPEKDIMMIIVNSSKYGGSGGYVAVANSGAPQIIAHEIGHSFVKLKDEYDYTASYTPSVGINATNTTVRANISWNYWIENSTPLPTAEITSNNHLVGVFEGANYRASGWYRPQNQCRMKSNGVDLCSVCGEEWILKIHSLVSPIDSASTNSSDLAWGDKLSVYPMPIKAASHKISWFLDGKLEVGETSSSYAPPIGTHTVKVSVEDTTSYVRVDTQNLLKDEFTWSINVVADNSSTNQGSSSSDITTIHNPNQTPHLIESVSAESLTFNQSIWNDFKIYNHQGQIIEKGTLQSSKIEWQTKLNKGHYILKINSKIYPFSIQ